MKEAIVKLFLQEVAANNPQGSDLTQFAAAINYARERGHAQVLIYVGNYTIDDKARGPDFLKKIVDGLNTEKVTVEFSHKEIDDEYYRIDLTCEISD